MDGWGGVRRNPDGGAGPGGRRGRHRLLGAMAAAADLVAPASCGGCRRSGTTWCADCAGAVREVCFADGPRRVDPDRHPADCPPTWARCSYAGVVSSALVGYKDRDRRDLREVLAPLLAEARGAAAAALGAGAPVVVPVPSSPAARRRRGDDPLGDLARAAWRLGTATGRATPGGTGMAAQWGPVLRVRRRVEDQAALGRGGRLANLAGAFSVRPGRSVVVAGRDCLLVDDVVTTGATLADAARALHQVGCRRVVAATVAETQARGRSS